MKKIERALTVAKPADKVWAYLSDFRSTNDWDPGTEKTTLESGDGGVGSIYKNISKAAGKEIEIIYTVKSVDPGRQIVLVGEASLFTSTDTITIDGTFEESVVTYEAEFEFHGASKLAEPFMGLPLKKLGDDAEKSLKTTLEDL